MSLLKNLMVDTRSAWVEYPGLRGFEIEIANLARNKLIELRKRCMITKFDRKTKQPIETLDEEKFVAEFTKATIKNWKGLKMRHLEELMLVDITGQDPDKDVPYSPEDAEALVSNSGDFDHWLNDAVFDLQNFRTTGDGESVDAPGDVAKLPTE